MRTSMAMVAGVLAAALAGCSTLEWQKAGVGESAAKSDMTACSEQARVNTPPQFSADKNTAFTNAASDAQRDTQLNQFPNRAYARDLQTEQSFVVRCMEEKGYSLVKR